MTELNPNELVAPPNWSIFVGLIGRILILFSAGSFAISGLSWFFKIHRPGFEKVGRFTFGAGCYSMLGAFLSLAILFAANRFEFAYVWGHSDTRNALAYRIAGIWSGQEGSFLLWATCSTIFALITVGKTDIYRRWYTIAYAFFLGGLASILAFESPFNLNLFEGKAFVPAEGLGLAPSLQNYWVIIHPPTIFLGFGSLTALFALAFAALAVKDYERWIPIVRPWGIVSVTLVGVGLCMGGFWAYETLGWGGFWMWDPVENVSFVPWCFGAAFIHGVIVQATKKKWQLSNMLLGALPFLAFMYGTYLTRSGLLSEASVHSFAEMDRSALKLLIFLMATSVLTFGGLWSFRAFQARKTAVEENEGKGIMREAFYMIGITALLTMGVATMIGMSVPFVQALRGQQSRVVEESLYHQVLPWIFIPIMLLMAVTPFVAWRGMAARELASKVYTVLCISVGITGLILVAAVLTPFAKRIELAPPILMLGRFEVKGLPWLMVLFGVCIFVIVGNTWRIAQIFKRSKMGAAAFVAHIGVAILMAGLILSRGFEQKGQSFVMQDRPGRLLSYEVRYAGMTSNERDRENKLKLAVYDPHKGDKPLFTATPGLYKMTMADGQESTMVWPHVERDLLMDTYVSLGAPQTNATEDITVPKGESVRFGSLILTYEDLTRTGEFGDVGTRFGARIRVEGPGGRKEKVNPQMEIGELGKTVSHPVKIDDNLELAMIGMNAADKSVVLRVQLMSPLYPVEIYHKPMTILVWLGTAVLTFSGFVSAFYRRSRRKVAAGAPEGRAVTKLAGDFVTAMQGDSR